MSKPIVIIGAGPAGLTAAWQLTKSGREVIVLEADANYVGGLARTVQAGDYRFDLGGHWFYSKNPEINEIWREIMPEEFEEIAQLARVYRHGRFFEYPLRPWNLWQNLGSLESLRILLSYLGAKVLPLHPEQHYGHWMDNEYGRHLGQLFFAPYTKKVWGLSGEEISTNLAPRQKSGLWTLLRRAFKKSRHKGLKASALGHPIYYPRLGPGQMWEMAASRIHLAGNRVLIGRKVQTFHWDETGVTHVTGLNQAGEFFQQEGTHFISSLPLKELIFSLDPPPPREIVEAARALRYRDLITVTLVVQREKIFPDNWLYIYDEAVKVARIQNYKNWSADLVPNPGQTTLGLEYYCLEGDGLWSAADPELARLAISEAVQLKLFEETEVKDAFVFRLPKAHPIYNLDYRRHLEKIRGWISQFGNLSPVGRNGLHRANNQDHSMMTGILAARNTAPGDYYDCWNVSADAEYISGRVEAVAEANL